MIIGQGNSFIQPNSATPPTVFPPFPLNAADNGLSVDPVTLEIVLGQSVGAAGDPARLLNNREIPMNGFEFNMLQGINQLLSINGSGVGLLLAGIGDIGSGFGNNGSLVITNNQSSNLFSSGTNYMGVTLDTTLRFASLGDVGAWGNSYTANIDDSVPEWSIGQRGTITNLLLNRPSAAIGLSFFDSNGTNPFLLPDPAIGGIAFITAPDFSNQLSLADAGNGTLSTLGDVGTLSTGMIVTVDVPNSLFSIADSANNAIVRINGVNGFTGTVAPPLTITVDGGIVTNVA